MSRAARLIGVILAEQTDEGRTERNDRLIAVAVQSRRHQHLRELHELPKQLLAEIEHFFVSYNEIKGKKFKPLGRHGSARALALVRKSVRDAAGGAASASQRHARCPLPAIHLYDARSPLSSAAHGSPVGGRNSRG